MLSGEPRWSLIPKVRSLVPLLCTHRCCHTPTWLLFLFFLLFCLLHWKPKLSLFVFCGAFPSIVVIMFTCCCSEHLSLWSGSSCVTQGKVPTLSIHATMFGNMTPVCLQSSLMTSSRWRVSAERALEQIFVSNTDASLLQTLLGLADAPSSQAAPLREVHLWSFASDHKPWLWATASLGIKETSCSVEILWTMNNERTITMNVNYVF